MPPLQDIFGTAALGPAQLALVAPFPVLVWGTDELFRWVRRRHSAAGTSTPAAAGIGRSNI